MKRAGPIRGRLTAEQQLAAQRKDKRGAKARKDMLADQEKQRDAIQLEYASEWELLVRLGRDDLDSTKDRLISRLTSNLGDLRLESARKISLAEAEVATLKDALKHFCDAFSVQGCPVKLDPFVVEAKSSTELAHDIAQLGDSVSARLISNEEAARKAELEWAIMEKQLRETKQQLNAAEQMILSKYVTSTTEYTSAAELFRRQGADFENRMLSIEEGWRSTLEDLIRRAAQIKQGFFGRADDGAPLRSCLDSPREELLDRYLSTAEKLILAQSALLGEVQSKILELTEKHVVRSLDRIRAGRTNIPSEVRDELAELSTHELLRVLDFVSFEPKVTETIIAAHRHRDRLEAAEACSIERAPYDVMTSAAIAVSAPRALAVMPPRAEKLAFTRATLIDAADRLSSVFGTVCTREAP